MLVVRYVLPAVLCVAGIVLLVAVPGSTGVEGFAMCVGAGLSVLLLNWLFRAGAQGDRERQREEAAREHYAEHGRWPDDD
jgi:hypothetical protein